MDPKERLSVILTEARELDAKGVLDKDSATRMAELLTEAKDLKGQIAMRGELGELDTFANQSAGKLPLAAGNGNGATVETIREAGATVVEKEDNGKTASVRIAQNYGEGNFDRETLKVIGTPEYQEAFRTYMRTGSGKGEPVSAVRTLQEGSDPSGGFLVPEDVLNRIIAREPTPTRIAGNVTQLQTSRDALVVPAVRYSADDLYTTGVRATFTNEIPVSSTAMRVTDPVFGQVRIPVFTVMLSMPLTNDLIEDTAFPLISYVAGKFAETIDLLKDNMIINGTGQGQPTGLLVNPGSKSNDGSEQPRVVTSGSASALTVAGLIKTAMSIPEQYDMNTKWVMNKTSTGNAIAQLVDGQGRPMWGAGLQDSGLEAGYMDRRLVGYPVVFSGFMPNVGANNYAALCGDLTGYYLANRVGFSIQVLRELYAETNQVLVLGRVRFGGLTAEPFKVFCHQCHT